MEELCGTGLDLDAVAKAVIEKKTGQAIDTSTLELVSEHIILSKVASPSPIVESRPS